MVPGFTVVVATTRSVTVQVLLQWLSQAEFVSEPTWDAAIQVADRVGDGPVEFPLLDERPLVAFFVAQECVLEAAAQASAEVHDRGGAGDDVVEVADCLGVG